MTVDYKAMSLKAVATRYGTEQGDPAYFCGRCGHNSSAHASKCRKCECPSWVHHICSDCGEWMAVFACRTCERAARYAERFRLIPTFGKWGLHCRIPDPNQPINEYKAAVKRKVEGAWLLNGQQTLKGIRRLLKHPEVLQSRRKESQQGRTSPS